MQNQVDILFTGYSYPKEFCNGFSQHANCTCTLIRTRMGMNIIVDTMTAWDGERIREEFTKYDLQPKDINYVVCTHGHSDHIGCNYLFQDAKLHIVGTSISNRDVYHDFGACIELSGGDVIVRPTPGHTLSCVSVLVRDTPLGDMVGICGDLFKCFEDIDFPNTWEDAGSENPQEQRRQRLRMAEKCAYIIPGHGPGFAVTPEVLAKLRENVNSNAAK